jgi:hypothetical protein
MKTLKKSLKLRRINCGFYTIKGYTPPTEITPTRLGRITTLLMRKKANDEDLLTSIHPHRSSFLDIFLSSLPPIFSRG